MARGHVDPGATMPWKNKSDEDVKNSAVVIVGALTGVALGEIPAGTTGELGMEDQWDLPKARGTAIEQGTPLYWDGTVMTTTAVTGRAPCHAWEDAEADADTVRVRINF